MRINFKAYGDHRGKLTIFVLPMTILADVALQFENFLAYSAGGWTETFGNGGWLNPVSDKVERDPVRVYRVAGLSSSDRAVAISFLLGHSNEKEIYTETHNEVLAGGWSREDPVTSVWPDQGSASLGA